MQQQSPATIPFSWAWVAFDLGDARMCASTYELYPYKDLPPIPTLDGTLSWLVQPGWQKSLSDSPEQQKLRQRRSAQARDEVRNLAAQAERLGLMLPSAFTRFMSEPDLHTCIPEYAGCWFYLDEAQLDPCPGSEDGYIVRFFNDQQDCALWYLYLTRQGAEAVLVARDPAPEGPSPYLERLVRSDEDGPLTEKQRQAVLARTYACAPSFEAFIYRWWLEATIYMKLKGFDSAPLTEEELRYLDHYWQQLLAW